MYNRRYNYSSYERRLVEEKPHWMQVLILALSELVFVVVAIPLYIWLVLPNHPEGELPGIVPPIAAGINPLVALGLAIAAFAVPLALFLTLYRFFGKTHFTSDEMLQLANDYSLADLAVVYLAAGIGEEFLFRGVFVEPCGVVVAALLFTATHFAYWKKPLVLAYTFAIGLVWGAFYFYVGSLALCALVHAAYNLVVTAYIKYKVLPNEA